MPATIRRTKPADAREVSWWIPNRIPRGRIILIDGDPGYGKSLISLDLAAAYTRGEIVGASGRVPSGNAPGNVLIFNAEDDVETTMLPRLLAARADLEKVGFGGDIDDHGRRRPLLLPQDTGELRRIILAEKAGLVVIDPIMAFLSEQVRTASDQSVRLALRGLKDVAEETNSMIVLIRHLNKSGGSRVIYRGGGSIGIIGLCRSAYYVGPDPEDPTVRVFAQIKNNLGPLAPALRFSVGQARKQRVVRWLGEADIPLSRLLDTPTEVLPVERAAKMLLGLCGKAGRVLIREAVAEARKRGYAMMTLRRAKERSGLSHERLGKEHYWVRPKTPVA
jgi:hypothetical protein